MMRIAGNNCFWRAKLHFSRGQENYVLFTQYLRNVKASRMKDLGWNLVKTCLQPFWMVFPRIWYNPALKHAHAFWIKCFKFKILILTVLWIGWNWVSVVQVCQGTTAVSYPTQQNCVSFQNFRYFGLPPHKLQMQTWIIKNCFTDC